MKRIIRFKGFRADGGGWVYGSLNTDNESLYEILNEEGGDYNVIPETVSQFTGLKDKNVVDIYEGDITTNTNGTVCKIVFIDEFMCFAGVIISSNYLLEGEYQFYQRIDEKRLEVTGNIHENKYLLSKPN